MQSRTILITGANAGLGWSLTKKLIQDPSKHKIIMACRSTAKAKDAITTDKDLSEEQKKNLTPVELNLANLNSIQECCNKLHKDFPEGINILVNNAGVYATGDQNRMETDNQFELHFGTNHLGHFSLTLCVLDLLRKGAMYSNSDSRIINVSSSLYAKAKIDFNDLQLKQNKPRTYNPELAYANSKLSGLYFAKILSERLQKDRTGQPGAGRIKIYSCCPGMCHTNLARYYVTNSWRSFLWWIAGKVILRTPEQGIKAMLECIEKPTSELKNGGFYKNGITKRSGNDAIKDESSSMTELYKDEEIAKKIWDKSEELTGVNLEADCNVTVSGPTNAMMF